MALALVLFLAVSYHSQNHVGAGCWRRGDVQEELKLPGYSDTEHCRTYKKPAETSHSFSWQLPDYAFPCSGSCLPTCLPWFSKQASVGCARTSHHPLYFKQVTSDQLGSRRCCFSRAVYFWLDSYMCVLCGILKTTVSSAFCRGIEQIIWTYLCHGSLVRATERFIQLGCCSSRKCKKILKFTEVVFPLPKRGCFCRNPNIW